MSMQRQKENTAMLSIISNSSLVVLKLIVGFMTGAVSIISEAVHSAVDLMASGIAYLAVKKAGRPPDENHAYGHGKIENLSAAIEAVLIIVAALWIAYEAVDKLRSPQQPEMLEWGIGLMLISIIVNYIVSGRLMKVAKETESQALEADALHLRADIWTSIAVLIGLSAIHFGGPAWIDPVIALAVAVIIFRAGYRMTIKSFAELIDIALPQEEEAKIVRIINSHPEIISFSRLRTRRSGSQRYIDVSLIFHPLTSLEKAHVITHALELQLESAFGKCDIIIHMEPCDGTNRSCDVREICGKKADERCCMEEQMTGGR